MTLRLLFLLALFLWPDLVDAKTARDPATPRQFQREQPCPSTGQRYGACSGWERDHVVPLCLGGADKPRNMQWLTVPDHRAKTRIDVSRCRNWR